MEAKMLRTVRRPITEKSQMTTERAIGKSIPQMVAILALLISSYSYSVLLKSRQICILHNSTDSIISQETGYNTI